MKNNIMLTSSIELLKMIIVMGGEKFIITNTIGKDKNEKEKINDDEDNQLEELLKEYK